jgi:tRNA (guanine-N7-)-methyltransferase
MTFRPRPHHPYARAPRLPDDEIVALESLLAREGAAPLEGPIEIEIGSGRGGFVFERCDARPDVRLLALEIRLKWATLVDERLVRRGYGDRARVFNADARDALRRFTPAGVVSVFFLHFPDPWWKKRHEKRLVMGEPLAVEMARLLRDGGEIFVQTDVEERAELYAGVLGGVAELEPAGDVEGSPRLAGNPYGARSPREHRAIEDGLPIERLRFRRRPRLTDPA